MRVKMGRTDNLARRTSTIAALLAAAFAAAFTPGFGSLFDVFFFATFIIYGSYLFFKDPPGYVSVTTFTWLLCPGLRRISDWHSVYHSFSLIMLVPLLLGCLAALNVVRLAQGGPRASASRFLLLVAHIPVVYGVLLGLLKGNSFSAIYGGLTWMVPIWLAGYLLVPPRDAIAVRASFIAAIIFCSFVLGAYGLFQFLTMPVWDRQWMISIGGTALGQPAPFLVRVFSLSNTPGPLALVLMASMLLCISSPSPVKLLGSILPMLAFLLSLVRSAWGGLAVGLVILFITSNVKQKLYFAMTAAITVMLGLPLLTLPPIQRAVMARLGTTTAIQQDESFQSRQALYSSFGASAATNLIGTGLGSTGVSTKLGSDTGSLGELGNFDSGIVDMVYSFGGVMSLIMIGSVVGLFGIAIRIPASWRSRSYIAIAMAELSQTIFGNNIVFPSGIVLFPFLALSTVPDLAAQSGNKIQRQRPRVTNSRTSIALRRFNSNASRVPLQ